MTHSNVPTKSSPRDEIVLKGSASSRRQSRHGCVGDLAVRIRRPLRRKGAQAIASRQRVFRARRREPFCPDRSGAGVGPDHWRWPNGYEGCRSRGYPQDQVRTLCDARQSIRLGRWGRRGDTTTLTGTGSGSAHGVQLQTITHQTASSIRFIASPKRATKQVVVLIRSVPLRETSKLGATTAAQGFGTIVESPLDGPGGAFRYRDGLRTTWST